MVRAVPVAGQQDEPQSDKTSIFNVKDLCYEICHVQRIL